MMTLAFVVHSACQPVAAPHAQSVDGASRDLVHFETAIHWTALPASQRSNSGHQELTKADIPAMNVSGEFSGGDRGMVRI